MNLPQKLDSHQLKNWQAACCVVIVEQSLFFILRSLTMPTHPGQIAFVGGGRQGNEVPLETALREFKEECGFELNAEFLGYLDPVLTLSSAGLIPLCFRTSLSKVAFSSQLQSNGEWSRSFYISIEELLDSSSWSNADFHFHEGLKKKVYFFPIHRFIEDSQTILWGASAAIVVDFLSKTQAL